VLYTVPDGKIFMLCDVVPGSGSVGELWIYKNASIVRRYTIPAEASLPGLLTVPIRYDEGNTFEIAVAYLKYDAVVLLNFTGWEY